MRVEWAGEVLELMPDRAVWWAREATLFVADLHLGKAAAFRSAGVPVPHGTTGADLARLGALLDGARARRLVVLGDLIHARSGRAEGTMGAVAEWRASRPGLEIVLIRGNHDRGAGDPPPEWAMECADGPCGLGPFTLAHEPPENVRRGEYTVSGHLHPAVAMERADGRAGGMRAACFWIRSGPEGKGGCMVLPAFGSFTGTLVVRPRVGDRVFPVGLGGVVEAVGVNR